MVVGTQRAGGFLRHLPCRLLEQLVCHYGGAMCWHRQTAWLSASACCASTWCLAWPPATEHCEKCTLKGSPLPKTDWGHIWSGACLSCHCLVIRALMPACHCWQVSVTVQICKGFKPLSTWLKCRMSWGPFLMYCAERQCTWKSGRGQRALRAFCNKLGKSQNVVG